MSEINIDLIKSSFINLIKSVLNLDQNEGLKGYALTIKEEYVLLKLAQKHDLAHFIAFAIGDDNLLSDLAVKQKLNSAKLLAVMRREQQTYEYNAIVKTFTEQKIPFIPLKGAIICNYYPETWLRTSCDIDILVKEEDLERAVKALVDVNGYKTDNKVNYHDISLFSPSNVHLELHFNVLEDEENIDAVLSSIWDYATPKENNSFEHKISNEFLVFHIIAHMMYHFLKGGCGVRTIMDVYVVRKTLSIDEDKLYGLLNECNIAKFYESIIELTNVWFKDQKHDKKTLKLENYIINGGIYGTLENRMKVDGTKVSNKATHIFRRIFCPYSIMKNRYPILKKRKWLLPFYEVVRWVETIFSGKAKRLKKEVEMLDNTSSSQKAEFKEFLDEIGL